MELMNVRCTGTNVRGLTSKTITTLNGWMDMDGMNVQWMMMMMAIGV